MSDHYPMTVREENIARSGHPYDNPDPACTYPVSGHSYCWSYAYHVDGGEKNERYVDMSKICPGCDLFVKKV